MIQPYLKNTFATVLAVCLLCLHFITAAQSNYYVERQLAFYGGVVAGTNFTQIDGDEFAGFNKVGLNIGAIVYVKFAKHIAASMEILYSQKGSRDVKPALVSSGLVITNYNIKLNYAEIPVMINYFDERKSNFGVGLSLSKLASSTESITMSPPQVFNPNQYPFKKDDLNILVGGNLHMWKGLFLNMRFQYSLLSIRDQAPTTPNTVVQLNRLWVVRLMYLFT